MRARTQLKRSDARFARILRIVSGGLALVLALAVALIVLESTREGEPDSERLADEVGAVLCAVPPGGLGGVYTCEFGDGERKRCYEVDFVPRRSAPEPGRELELRVMLRHGGACTPDDKPSASGD